MLHLSLMEELDRAGDPNYRSDDPVIRDSFTICSATRWSGSGNPATSQRKVLHGTPIVAGSSYNWLHGHGAGGSPPAPYAGVADYGDGWKTPQSPQVDPVTDWVIMCGSNAGAQLTLVNGVDVGTGELAGDICARAFEKGLIIETSGANDEVVKVLAPLTTPKQTFVKGLKQLFGERVAIFSLDPQSTRARGVQPDHEVYISYDQVTVDDVATLQDELKLNPTAVESAYLVYAIYKDGWLRTLLAQEGPDVEEFAKEIGAHPGSLVALHRKLKRLENFPFMVQKGHEDGDVVDRIMEYLDRGINVVLEFGQQTSMLCYLLVANIISRRIHEMYVKKSERFYSTQKPEDQPRQLMITIEEAHKFLNPSAAKQTIFGTIAREMRKYYVSLLVVDQRPSGIDDEVLSQIGTRITALLNDEKDIQAVLTGVSGTDGLRSVLASLDSKQQALVIGHAVPMPVVIKTREYGAQFYRDMGCLDDVPPAERRAQVEKKTNALYGDN